MQRIRMTLVLLSLAVAPLCMGAKGCQDQVVGEAPPPGEQDDKTDDDGAADDGNEESVAGSDAGPQDPLPEHDGGTEEPMPIPNADVYWSRFSYYGDDERTNGDWYTVTANGEVSITPIGTLAGEGPPRKKLMSAGDFQELASVLEDLRSQLTTSISCAGPYQFEIVIDTQEFTQGDILGSSPSGGVCDPSGGLVEVLGRYSYF